MTPRQVAGLVGGVLALILLFSCFYVVEEGHTALKIRLGKVQGEARGPGLHFKLPLVEEVVTFDARILSWDGDTESIPVRDSKFIQVDTFARWRIIDPHRFFNAVRDERGAQSRLDDILDGSIRDIVSAHYLLELVRTTDNPLATERVAAIAPEDELPAEVAEVREVADVREVLAEVAVDGFPLGEDLSAPGRRLEIRQAIFDLSNRKLEELDLGIELVDLRIKRIDYTDQVRQEVYRRMVSGQERLAERYRAQGEGKRAEIAGGTNQERRRIESESYRRAQEIMGAAEAESTRIYAEAYNPEPELYRFVKSLETYRQILGSEDTLILSTDSDLLRYLKSQR
jgi:modulator of FtsH protease HflC